MEIIVFDSLAELYLIFFFARPTIAKTYMFL